jgi:hypothetical protein
LAILPALVQWCKAYRAIVPKTGREYPVVKVYFDVEMSDRHWMPPYQLRNVEPNASSGFGWGYGGAGAMGLALSLLTDALADTADSEFAAETQEAFLTEVIAGLDKDQGWTLHQQQILNWFKGWQRGWEHDERVVQRRIEWALALTPYAADEYLLFAIKNDLMAGPGIGRLSSYWSLSKLEIAEFVSSWMREHPERVSELRWNLHEEPEPER